MKLDEDKTISPLCVPVARKLRHRPRDLFLFYSSTGDIRVKIYNKVHYLVDQLFYNEKIYEK